MFDPNQSILPRSAWSSQLVWLKAMMKAKQILDREEKTFAESANLAPSEFKPMLRS
jgi:hypothetical protein